METKFKALRVLSAIHRILAWVVLVVGVLVGVAILALTIIGGGTLPSFMRAYAPGWRFIPGFAPNTIVAGIIGFLGTLLCSSLSFLVLHATSEFILLALSLEENTRETAYYLRGEGVLPNPPDSGVPLSS